MPPIAFTACIADGGKVVTKSLPNGKYIHLCKDREGNWHEGEVKTKKSEGKDA